MINLNDELSQSELNAMLRSWMAWSATNILFSPKGKVFLGVRSNAEARAIPEPGDLALVGGFNTLVDGPAMFRDVANAHAKAQLGIDLTPGQCSGFLPCEYEMVDISEPLKTPQGDLHIKRVAFDRVVVLTDEQVMAIKPAGKLRDGVWATQGEFEAMVDAGGISFPHQVQHVLDAFDLIEAYVVEIKYAKDDNRSIPGFATQCKIDWN